MGFADGYYYGQGRFIVDTSTFGIGDTIRVKSMTSGSYTDKQVATVGTPLIFDVPSKDYYKVCTVQLNTEVGGAYYTVDYGQTHYVNVLDKATLRGIQGILNAHQEATYLAVGDEVTVKINGVDETYIILAMNVYASHEVILGWKYVSEALTSTPVNYSSRATVNTYCDNIYANMTNEDQALIKNKTVNYSHSGTMAYTDRKIWLPTRYEVFGDQANEANTNTQLTYFVTQANRIRSQKGGSATEWQTATSNADGSKVVTTSTAGATSTTSSARAIMPCFHLTADM